MAGKTKPPLAQWIVEQREGKDWKLEELARRVREAGYEAKDSTVRTWESGRRPHPDTIRGLERLFGSSAPVEGAAPADLDALVAALDRHANAVSDLVLRLDRLTTEQSAAAVEMMRALGTLGRNQGLEGTPDGGGHEAHAGTAK